MVPLPVQLIDAAPEALNATDALGRTVLMLAATGGSVEVIQLLHKRSAPIDATSRDGRTALIWAVIAHKFWAVEALALLGADPELRERLMPENRMEGAANVLIFAQADAASGVRNILRLKAGALEVGPILMGMANRAHIVTPSITARGLLNISALAGTPVGHYG